MINKSQERILKMFSDLTFDSQRHLYYWKGVRVPLSVTGLVKQFIPIFDADNMSIFSAKKQSRLRGHEVTPHELKREWQLKNNTACEVGTKVHNFLENYTGIEHPELPQERAGINYIKDLRKEGKYRVCFRELRAYSREFNFAGTMDIPLEVIGDTSYVIDDYKTNGDLFKSYDYLLPPFEYLEASAYNEYQIQLSYYQIMLEEIGIKIDKRRLVYLMADKTYRIFDLIDLTGELRLYMRNQLKPKKEVLWY